MRSSPDAWAAVSFCFSCCSRWVSSASVVDFRKRTRLFCCPSSRRKPYSTRSSAGVHRLTKPRHGDHATEIDHFSGSDEREQDVRPRREHGRGGSHKTEQQVPPRHERVFQVLQHAGATKLVSRHENRRASCRPAVERTPRAQSPARVEGSNRSIMSRRLKTTSRNAGSRCITCAGRSGGGTLTSFSIVPGADEMTNVRSPRYTASSIECVTKNTVA